MIAQKVKTLGGAQIFLDWDFGVMSVNTALIVRRIQVQYSLSEFRPFPVCLSLEYLGKPIGCRE